MTTLKVIIHFTINIKNYNYGYYYGTQMSQMWENVYV